MSTFQFNLQLKPNFIKNFKSDFADKKSHEEDTPDNQHNITEEWIEQPLDHFDSNNDRTWFMVNFWVFCVIKN